MVLSLFNKFSSKYERRLLSHCCNNNNTNSKQQKSEQPNIDTTKSSDSLDTKHSSSRDIDRWNQDAVHYLVRKLKKDPNIIEELDQALADKSPKSRCVLVSKTPDKRLLISHRRALPQVVYCRMWRWPDLQSHHQIKAIPTCTSSVKSSHGVEQPLKSNLVCINPYHYDKTCSKPIKPVQVPFYRFPPDLSTSFEDSDQNVTGTRARAAPLIHMKIEQSLLSVQEQSSSVEQQVPVHVKTEQSSSAKQTILFNETAAITTNPVADTIGLVVGSSTNNTFVTAPSSISSTVTTSSSSWVESRAGETNSSTISTSSGTSLSASTKPRNPAAATVMALLSEIPANPSTPATLTSPSAPSTNVSIASPNMTDVSPMQLQDQPSVQKFETTREVAQHHHFSEQIENQQPTPNPLPSEHVQADSQMDQLGSTISPSMQMDENLHKIDTSSSSQQPPQYYQTQSQPPVSPLQNNQYQPQQQYSGFPGSQPQSSCMMHSRSDITPGQSHHQLDATRQQSTPVPPTTQSQHQHQLPPTSQSQHLFIKQEQSQYSPGSYQPSSGLFQQPSVYQQDQYQSTQTTVYQTYQPLPPSQQEQQQQQHLLHQSPTHPSQTTMSQRPPSGEIARPYRFKQPKFGHLARARHEHSAANLPPRYDPHGYSNQSYTYMTQSPTHVGPDQILGQQQSNRMQTPIITQQQPSPEQQSSPPQPIQGHFLKPDYVATIPPPPSGTYSTQQQVHYSPQLVDSSYPASCSQPYSPQAEQMQLDQQPNVGHGYFNPMMNTNQVMGNQEQTMIDIQEVPYIEGTSWCSISYHEYDQRIGEKYYSNCWRVVSVDGYTQPLCTDRFCIGGISNVNRNQFTEWVRRRIGRGVRLTYIDGEVYVEGLSESSVYVSNPLLAQEDGENIKEHVSKLTQGCSAKVFSTQEFQKLLADAVSRGFEAVYKLTRACVIRVSFVKGWGPNYKRSLIYHTPCWVEVQLNGPLQWIDKVLRQMRPPTGCGSTS